MFRFTLPVMTALIIWSSFYNAAPRHLFKYKAIAALADTEQIVLFSGYKWKVRNAADTQYPGPNFFNTKSVWVDKKGFLHLYLHKDSLSGNWLCAEVTSEKKFGYGTYSFDVESALDKFDKNIVLGLFNYSGNDGFDEMDIEFSRWGNDSFPNLNYTVWPATKEFKNTSYTKEYQQQGDYSTQQFAWSKNRVIFSTFKNKSTANKSVFATYTCTQPPSSISALEMPVHLNLWLFNGTGPADQKPVEVVIHSFTFKRYG